MIKILFVIPRLAKAGTEKHLIDLCRALNKEKFEVEICCLFEIGDAGQDLKNTGINVFCLKRKNVYDLRLIFDLYKLMRRKRYNVVHSYLFCFHYLAALPARIAGVPAVITSRRELARWKKLHHRAFEDLGNIFADKVVACSNAARRFSLETENLPEKKIVTIYNGIDLSKFFPREKNIKIIDELKLQSNDVIIGMVANLSSIKDHGTLLGALGLIRKTNPEIKCLLIGEGLLRGHIIDKIKLFSLENNVFLLGARDNISEFLSIMDLFVLTSQSEGLPNTVLEAMACALPVVATNVGGIPELIEDGESGILVEPRNIQSIANAIIRLIKNKDLKERMGKRGREIAQEKFSINRMVDNYEVFYSGLIK